MHLVVEANDVLRELLFVLKYLGFEPRLQSRYRDRDLFIAERMMAQWDTVRCMHVSLHGNGILVPNGAIFAGAYDQPLDKASCLEDVVHDYVAIMEL
ncbi:MAG: hypothetical protein JWO15_3611 [Sphingomonadales bacterium]|nr:hypothetical protein [Sphingomonadales bacterium]